MSDDLFIQILYGSLLYFSLFIFISFRCSTNFFFCFNPKENYKTWDMLNWFGVWFFTILYWIAFLPFTIMAIIYWLFTTRRKRSDTE